MLVSCGSLLRGYWLCNVDAIGEQPSSKTYFVEENFPKELNPLLAKEYIKDLDIMLSHLGYIKEDSSTASIKIKFGYAIGEKEQVLSSSPVFDYNPPAQTTTRTTIKDNEGTTVATVKSTSSTDNEYGKVTYAGEKTSTKIKQPITFTLDAFYYQTEEPVWSVHIYDEPSPELVQNLRKYMPLYLLSMYPYVGSNTGERRYSIVHYNDERLLWFDSQTR